MRMYLICVRSYDDTYYRFIMAEDMLNSPAMFKLRKLAHSKGYRVDMEPLSSIEDAEAFLMGLDTRRLSERAEGKP